MDGIDKDRILETGKERFTKALEHYDTEYTRGDEDVEFALGNQWDEAEKKSRADDFRPALTENHCMPFIEQIVNTAREMRPTVKVAPVDDKGDKDTAEVFKGLIRNIERQSKASVAYDTAVQNSVMSGYGWIRINTNYDDPMSFNQDIKIEVVPDWKSVALDPASQMIDGSDAEYGFIYSDVEQSTFKADYPDHEPVSFEGTSFGDKDEDKVRIVEYFYKEYEETDLYECFMIDGTVQVLLKKQHDELGEAVVQVLQERKTKLPTVKWCKLYGGGILEETEWLGQYIPLIPVYGKLVWHDDRLRSYSLITHAKDPQRMLNIVKTTIAEIVGSQPKNQPMIGAVGQFETDGRWENANTENYSSLEYDPVFVTDEVTGQSMLAPPPMKQMPMQVSPALFQMEATAQMGIKASLGMYEENRGDESNAISGVAIKSRQLRGDKATFHFIDNLACSIRHVGVVLIDLIPKIYNKKQILRIIGTDDKEKTVGIDPEGQTDPLMKDGGVEGVYNLNAGKYDVDVDVGPSYATQQQEFLDIAKTMIAAVPEFANIAGDKMIEAAGGPYADVIAERIRANMPPEMQSDDPMAMKLMETMKQLQAIQQEQETLLMALDDKKKNEEFANQIQSGELKIKGAEAETKRLKVMAEIEKMRIETEGIAGERMSDTADAILEMHSMLQALSAQTGEHEQVIDAFLSMEESKQATSQPEGAPAV